MADDPLLHVLGEIRRRGGIGTISVEESIVHSEAFVRHVPPEARAGIDLGSGGGLPALVLAVRCPQLRLTLVERRAMRADLLRYGVRALGVSERVQVVEADVADVVGRDERYDLVTARSFAPLPATLQFAAELLAGTGAVLVSAAPDATPAHPDLLARCDLIDLGTVDGVHRFRRGVFHVEHPRNPSITG